MVKRENDIPVLPSAFVKDGTVHLTNANYGSIEDPVCSYAEAIKVVKRLEDEIQKLGPLYNANPIAGYSFGGFNFLGDTKSIDWLKFIKNQNDNNNLTQDYLKRQIEELKNGDREKKISKMEQEIFDLTRKNRLLEKKLQVSKYAAGTYCWERYKNRPPMNLRDSAYFTSHEWQKIEEVIQEAVDNVT